MSQDTKRVPTESDIEVISAIAMRRAQSRAPTLMNLQVAQYEAELTAAFERGENPKMVDLRPRDISRVPDAALADASVAEGDGFEDEGFYSTSIVEPLRDDQFGKLQVVVTLDDPKRTRLRLNVRGIVARALKKPWLTKGPDGAIQPVPIKQADVIIATEWGHRPKDGYPGITVRELGGAVSVLWFRGPNGVPYIGLQRHKRGMMVCPANPEGASYECPRGFREPGEQYEQTALRELQEAHPVLNVEALRAFWHELDSFSTKGLNANTAMFNYPTEADGSMKGVDFVFRELPAHVFAASEGGTYSIPTAQTSQLLMQKDERGKIGNLVFYRLDVARSMAKCLMTRYAITEVACRAVALSVPRFSDGETPTASLPAPAPASFHVVPSQKGTPMAPANSTTEFSLKRALELFSPDKHAGLQGWKPTPHMDGRVNPRGWALSWVTVPVATKAEVDGVTRQGYKPGYDQPVIIEDPGAIIIATDDLGRIALIENYRFIADRLPGLPVAGYVKALLESGRWEELVGTAGRESLECPRGLLNANELSADARALAVGADVTAFVKHTARAEGLEEGGLVLDNLTFAGWINWNTTFCLHSQAVVRAHVKSVNKQAPEEFEHIGALRFVSPQELRRRIDEKQFVDGLTLGALALCGIQIPPSEQV